MQLSNYLFFTTTCEQALAFYAECSPGKVAGRSLTGSTVPAPRAGCPVNQLQGPPRLGRLATEKDRVRRGPNSWVPGGLSITTRQRPATKPPT